MNANQLIFGTGVSSSKDYDGLLNVVREAVQNGICSFDTAPSYKTESTLGKVLRQVMRESDIPRSRFFIQTKIDAWQMQQSNGEISSYVRTALTAMGLDYFDSLLIHWPLPEQLDSTWHSFIRLHEEGSVRQIGVCNVRLRHLQRFLNREMLPQIVQIERNPLRTCEAEITFCHEHRIAVQAYSPLCKMDERIKNSRILAEIAAKYCKSVGQIVLRWHLDTGVLPVFTSTKPERVREYADIEDFSLTQEEVFAVSSLNKNYKMYLESWSCPGF